MKKFLLFLFSTTIVFVASAQNNSENPLIKFDTTTHDFGKFLEGKIVSYEFVFSNIGKAPLILGNVQPSCGCTTPEWPREPIMPGQKSTIKAVYNPGAYKGTFSKGITVSSNASNGNVQLVIKGTVLEKPVEPVSPIKTYAPEGGF